MKLLVDKVPTNPEDCLFSIYNDRPYNGYSYGYPDTPKCQLCKNEIFGDDTIHYEYGSCELENSKKCPYLISLELYQNDLIEG